MHRFGGGRRGGAGELDLLQNDELDRIGLLSLNPPLRPKTHFHI